MKMKGRKYLGIIIFFNLSLWVFGSFLGEVTFAAPVDFPKKEITIIVNMGPGGSRDIIARGVGKTMSKHLGVPMVILNLPGAGGARGILSLCNSAADGYTIGVGAAPDVTDQILEKREYDHKKFTYIGGLESSYNFFFVKPDSPFRSLKDFKSFGKPVRKSTFSLTANPTIIAMVIANREGFPLVIVGGYQGAAASLLALVRGEVEFSASMLSTATPFLQSGQIRPIMTMYPKRSPVYPDIPSIVEVGHQDLACFATGSYFMAPPGVPKARVQILEEALMKTHNDPEFLDWAKKAGVEPVLRNGEETEKLVISLFGLLEQYKGDIEKYIKK